MLKNLSFNWFGKVVGMVFGYALLGIFGLGIIGALIGLALGHQFDKAFAKTHWFAHFGKHASASVKAIYFSTLFGCMGHLAKADGQVTTDEISAASHIMDELQLTGDDRRKAIDDFTQGKSADYDLLNQLNKLARQVKGQRSVLRMFMQFQFKAAFADGNLSEVELALLARMAATLGFNKHEFKSMLAMFQAQHAFSAFRNNQSSWQGTWQQQHSRQHNAYEQSNSQQGLYHAYALLGVESTISDVALKKAYRKLMNEYHPDKLAAKGLPAEMLKEATEKTQNIKAAYELIKRHRAHASQH